ncbi:lipopolysaccharide biosynthesis protein [Rhodococcoides corynebacterioides]|uniref:lipopolysaccharide biosynthesis protein n=1 Tax=Rhodococcoides corynebacterioides TaxID=53972 RepID=UPI003AD8426E
MTSSRSHVVRAGVASLWNYAGRGVGLLWTLAFVHALGVASYGQYAVAVACAALVNAALDNVFHVRALRASDDVFLRERSARVLLAIVVAAIGIACYREWFVVGFALLLAAGEMLFDAAKSSTLRRGRPDSTMRYDAARQVASIGCGLTGLLAVDSPTVAQIGLYYLLPYFVIGGYCLKYLAGHRPAFEATPRSAITLTLESLAAAVYIQSDVIVVGWMAGDTVAGYYSLASVAALALSTIGQNYANTFIDRMREAGGRLSAAPTVGETLSIGLATGAAMTVVAVGILAWGGADYTGHVALVLAVFVAARTVDHSFILLLIVQNRDRVRVRIGVMSSVAKVAALVSVTGPFGGYGAATVTTLCEVAAAIALYRAVHHHIGETLETPPPGRSGAVR